MLGVFGIPDPMPAPELPAAPPYQTIQAQALLMAPAGTPEQPPSEADWPALQAALHRVAVRMEVLDARETRYVLGRVEDFQTDLDLIRRRYEQLKDAPPVADADRFPPRDVVQHCLQFNWQYREHLEERLAWEPDRAAVIGRAIGETASLRKVWEAASDARCEFYYVTVRRHALLKLREALGPDAYAGGDLPPHVPTWRFIERGRR